MIAAIVGALLGLAGVIFGLFKHQAAQVATAKAKTSDVEKQAAVDKLNAVTAGQAAEQAAQQQLDSQAAGRTDIDAQIAAKSAEEVQDELNQHYSR